jgi:hypothetical protein
MNTYEQVREKSLPLIKAYHDDLIKYDKREIAENPGVPFLHFTGDTGTYAFFMIPAEEYPAKGKIVPYLFGKADRFHILRQFVKLVENMRRINRQSLILYFNGKRLIEISQERAESLAQKYECKILHDWRKAEAEERKNHEQKYGRKYE